MTQKALTDEDEKGSKPLAGITTPLITFLFLDT
jgi:hypothetical protein